MKPKVLMLGWEFPPIINGGLGVASLGLAAALPPYADLTMIIPRSDPDFTPEGLRLIGVDNVILKDLFEEKGNWQSEVLTAVNLEYVDVPLAGYEQPTLRIQEKEIKTESSTLTIERNVRIEDEILPDKFEISELYGSDLLNRIREYSAIVSRMAKDMDFDIIHAHDWMTFLAALEIKEWSGKPLVVHLHSIEYDRLGPDSRGFAWYMEKHTMEQADLVIPVSNYSGKLIEEQYEIDPEKIVPIHNGVDKIGRKRNEKPFPQKLVVFLGRITAQKGPESFLKVAWKVLENYDRVRFVIAGSGDLLPDLMEKVAQERLGDRIHFTEFLSRKDVMKLLSMADVFVMPSVSEPFGLSAVEAASMGTACVISRQSGVAEVLPHALIADHWDIDSMAEFTLSLLEHPDLNEAVVKTMQEDIEELSWDLTAQKVIEAYKNNFEF